ncbi:MAG TPA: iron export ABC transporter permease subunit FetB [Spirochaetia bacterium]|nr:iron export ABC transporter permease subunit FetB [Spirochaetia bacterium]
MDGIIQIDLFHLALGYIIILLITGLVRLRRLGRELEILVATFRMTVQLILVGYLLSYLFDLSNPWLTLGIFLIMEGFAVYTVFGRLKKARLFPSLKRVIALCMVIGTSFSLIFLLFLVIQLRPWFNPRYFIPIAGMIIGNSMNGISIGVERLASGMRGQLARVEGALMLGATPREAARPFVSEAFAAAIMPTMNNMMGMGIVFLPGMMTGQILSGISPLTAIQYQIAIMLGIAGSVSISVFLVTELGYRRFFTGESQLIPEVYATAE